VFPSCCCLDASNRLGHDITLFEKSFRLGGQILLASVPSYKQALDKVVKWLSQEIEREGVEIRLNTGGDVNCIEEQRPDVVMLATGARPILPIAVSSHDILSA
jgi:NAD(H)-dependent 7beta-hydroxy-3-oxo-delta4-cholenoic acid oxidoreductase